MASNQLKELHFNLMKRVAPLNGAFTSDIWNDSIDELIVDITNISNEWNPKIVAAFNSLPFGDKDTAIDAFVNGIDGENLWLDATATASTNDPRLYNSSASRPYTIAEAIRNLYSYVDTLIESGSSGSSTTVTDNLNMMGYNITNIGYATASKDIEITDSSYGLILESPDGTRWRLTINNLGSLIVTSL